MLSIVIPTLNAQEHLPHLLSQLDGYGGDIVISDGGSQDGTVLSALSAGMRLAIGCKGRGWQLARGARWAAVSHSADDWYLFLHADTILPDNWLEASAQHMKNYPQKAAYFRYGLDAKGFGPTLLAFFVRVRCVLFSLPYGDQGLLISRTLYDHIGGFQNVDLFEDVDIIRTLGRQRLRALSAEILTSAARYQRRGYLRTGFKNLGLLIRYILGADRDMLKQRYYK